MDIGLHATYFHVPMCVLLLLIKEDKEYVHSFIAEAFWETKKESGGQEYDGFSGDIM
jgi:hypothetical protein